MYYPIYPTYSTLGYLAVLLEARRIIEPTLVFTENQAYDNSRTNAQYILNQLQLQKNVKNLVTSSIDFCDDSDAIEEGQEAGNRLTNTLIQYDSSIYTCIFIPSDDGKDKLICVCMLPIISLSAQYISLMYTL